MIKSSKKEKGDKGYLKYKKILNLIIMIALFAVVLIIFFAGIIINKTRNSIFTVGAILMVLPAAKAAVAYFILLPHKSCTDELAAAVDKYNDKFAVKYDCIFSNKKSPIGTSVCVITDCTVCAYTTEEKADVNLFETSVKEFLKADKLNVNVTLYKDQKAFTDRIEKMYVNFDETDKNASDKISWNTKTCMNMCL